jgi:hypothetical protein
MSDPDPHARLPFRTYSYPFVGVWQAVMAIAASQKRWTVTRSDGSAGTIELEVRGRIFKSSKRLEIAVGLDANGQTRVDVVSASRSRHPDLGRAARRIARFLQILDDYLEPLDASAGLERVTRLNRN